MINENEFSKAFDIMQQRPAPKLGPPVGAPPEGHFFCSGCKKVQPNESLRYHFTGVCRASDSLCEECEKLTPKHALIVCVTCQAVVARIPPERFADGFEYEPRKAYHIWECGNCKPGIASTRVIEAELFRRDKS